MAPTAFDVELDHVESCSCPPACPCQFAGLPSFTHCHFLIGYQIRKGMFGSVKLDGATFAIIAMYPGAIHQGNGRVVLFVDEHLSDPQVDAIAQILGGKHGGMPWEALAATVSAFEGPIRSPLKMKVDGTRSSFGIPNVIELQQTPLKDSVSGADKEVHIVYPKGGFFWNDGNVCTTSAMRSQYAGHTFDHTGFYSASAVTRWTNSA